MNHKCAELLCLMEKELPTSFFNIQEHLLIHLVDEITIAGVVSTRWMFFFERYMKVLKNFVRQRARPEGSMAEGYIVQESLYYVTEYLLTIDPHAPRLWSDADDEKVSGEVLQGMGKETQLTMDIREKINTFILYNSESMEKWLELYELERASIIAQRKRKRRRNRRAGNEALSIPDLLPEKCPLPWVANAIRKARERGEAVSNEEMEIAYGCDWKVHLFCHTVLFQCHVCTNE